MWMMGYSDAGDINDPFSGRKLRPLMPRPTTAAVATPPCLTRIHGNDIFALNHHLASAAMAEQNKRDLNTQQVVVSSRWNPTPEQLHTLEELYQRGTRTPSAEQIQHITAQLRRYGKIEGKNVFYWFQNHKARERQKRQRQLESFADENGEKREASGTGTNRALCEVEQIKNWASPTSSSTAAEKSGEAEAEYKADDGWVQLDDDTELQRRRNATWQMMNLSCSSSSTNLINSSSAPTVTVPAVPSTLATVRFKPQNFINIFLEPNSPHGAAAAEAQTLQLFPLQSGGGRHNDEECSDNEEEEEEEESGGSSFNNIAAPPCQFFEFLPLKN